MEKKRIITLLLSVVILSVVACFSIVGMLPRWISLVALALMVGGCVGGICLHMRQTLPRQLFIRAIVAMVAVVLFACVASAREVLQHQYISTGAMISAIVREILQWIFCGSYLVWFIFRLLYNRMRKREEKAQNKK